MRKSLSLLAVCVGALMLGPALAQRDDGGRGQGGGGNQNPPRFHRHGPDRIANSYIVVLDEDPVGAAGDFGAASARAEQVILKTPAGRVTRVYAHAISGFAAEMTEEEAIALSEDPDVRFVEEDSVVEAVTTQTNATWGLDRIDQTDLPLNSTYTYTSTGSGVNAYIIDTGIRRTHTQFGGRAFVGFDAIGDGRNTNDCNGHGTHVSGTVGLDVRRREERPALCRARAQLQRLGDDLGRHRGHRLGHRQPHQPRRRQHEPRGRRIVRARCRRQELDRVGCHLRRGGGQLERERRELLAIQGRRGDHGRLHDAHRRPFLVLELRQRRGHLCTGIQYHVGVEHERHGHEYD